MCMTPSMDGVGILIIFNPRYSDNIHIFVKTFFVADFGLFVTPNFLFLVRTLRYKIFFSHEELNHLTVAPQILVFLNILPMRQEWALIISSWDLLMVRLIMLKSKNFHM